MEDNSSAMDDAIQFEVELMKEGYPKEFVKTSDYTSSIVIKPQVDPEAKVYVSVKLEFDVSPPYPKDKLICKVVDVPVGHGAAVSNLSAHQLKELQSKLDKCAEEKAGDVSIKEIVELAKDYVTDNNKPSTSLHQEMITRREEDKKREGSESFEHITEGNERYPPCLQRRHELDFMLLPTSKGDKRTAMCALNIGPKGMFKAFDLKHNEEYTIHEYIIKMDNIYDLEKLYKDTERELNMNYIAFRNINLLQVKGVSIPMQRGHATSNILHIVTHPSQPLLLSAVKLPYHAVNKLAADLINGLRFLHNQDCIHGELSIDCVYYSATRCVHQIGYYGPWQRVLRESVRGNSRRPWFCKDKQCDVLLLGHTIYHAAVGNQPQDQHPDIPIDLPEDLKDFLEKCMVKDGQFTLENLSQHSLVQTGSVHPSAAISCSHETIISDSTSSSGEESVLDYMSKSRRFNEDFEYKGRLGQGGFGNVFKVKHKLDKNIYAMKVILLRTASPDETRKVEREAEVLSQLRHPCIVQYNNTFIANFPKEELPPEETRGQSNATTSGEDDMDSSSHWNTSYKPENRSFRQLDYGITSRYRGNELCIEFDRSAVKSETPSGSEELLTPNSDKGISLVFIQMEFCDNKTLRNLINCRELHKDLILVKTLLRQIIDALEYIHSKGVIHRDLKPDNIFLTSRNLVKIGDFGLAAAGGNKDKSSGKQSFSGVVGTSYYIAPEVRHERRYAVYNDIYSLGVICFEMVHKPFPTNQERYEVLSRLREKDIHMPPGIFSDENLEKMTRSMLSHDVKERPTAKVLSESEILPPRLEEEGLQELVRFINSDPDSPRHQQLLRVLFESESTGMIRKQYAEHDTADTESQSQQFTLVMNDVINILTEIFITHGALQFPLPFVLPGKTDDSYCFLSRCGYIQSLPYNLKHNLIRHIIKNKVTNLKRYGFSQIFRKQPDNKDRNPNPNEILEGSLDIVTSGDGVIAAGELLQVVMQVQEAMPYFKDLNSTIFINHSNIVKSILLSFGIHDIYHDNVLKTLCENKRDLPDKELFVFLRKHGVKNDESCRSLKNLLRTEGVVSEIGEILKTADFMRIYYHAKRNNRTQFETGLKQLLQILILVCNDSASDEIDDFSDNGDIHTLLDKLRAMPRYNSGGLKDIIKIRFGLMNDSSSYKNFMLQWLLESPHKSNEYQEIAVGGEFTFLFEKWKGGNQNCNDFPKAYGVTFLLEDIAGTEQLIREKRKKQQESIKSCSVLIVSESESENKSDGKEALLIHKMLTILWKYNIKAYRLHYGDPTDHIVTYNHLVTFKSKDNAIFIETDPDVIRNIKGHDDESIGDKYHKYKFKEAIEYLLKCEGIMKKVKVEQDVKPDTIKSRDPTVPSEKKTNSRTIPGKQSKRNKNTKNTKAGKDT